MKKQIAQIVAKRMGCSYQQAYDFMTATLDAVIEVAPTAGKVMTLRNFGTFKFLPMKGWKSKHPWLGTDVEVPPHTRITFVASRQFRRTINPKKDKA